MPSNAIPEHELPKAYLRRELGAVEKSLSRLVLRWAHSPPKSFPVALSATTWGLEHHTVSVTAFHQNMVVRAFQLQSLLLKTDATIISTFGGAIATMSSRLGEAELHDDALMIRKLGVDFWRELIGIHPSRNVQIALTAHLTNLSVCYENTGNKEQAYETSQEAIRGIHQLLGTGNGADSKESLVLRELLARNLALQANYPSTSTNNIDMASLAVGTMKRILEVEDSHDVDVKTPQITTSHLIHHRCYTYSKTLLNLSKLLEERQNNTNESLVTKKEALRILDALAIEYPHSRPVLEEKANLLFVISGHKYRFHNSTEENWTYTRQCISIYRQLLRRSGAMEHLYLLSSALFSRKQFLVSMGRLEEAEAVHKEITSLADSAVERYLDLRIPSETEGDYYFHLSQTYKSARHLPGAIHAAQNAVAQYSGLGLLYPHRSPFKHVRALKILCALLFESRHYRAALAEANKAIQIIDNSGERMSSQFKEKYLELFDSVMDVLANISETNLLQRATDIGVRFQTIVLSRPTGKAFTMTSLPATYMVILNRNGMFNKAIHYAESFLSTWKDTTNHFTDPDIVYPYLKCMKARYDLMKARGLRAEALECNSQAIHFFRVHAHPDNSALVRRLQGVIAYDRVVLLCDAFRYKEALEFSQELIQTYRNRYENSETMISALHYLGLAQLHNCIPLHAIETAREGLSLCQSEISNGQTYPRSWVYILSMGLVDALFDDGRVDEAWTHLHEAKNALSALQSSVDEQARYIISSRSSQLFFANGEYSKATELIPEIIKYDTKVLATDKFILGRLVKVLRFAGIAFCCSGQHEKGVASLTELKNLMEDHAISDRDCAREAQTLLELETHRGKWKVISKIARTALQCNHHDTILDMI